jgi:hypothetical protein
VIEAISIAMNSRFHRFIYQWPLTHYVLGIAILLFLTAFYSIAGAFNPGSAPWYFDSDREFQGMVLMLITMPAYIAICYVKGTRRSREIAASVDEANGTELADTVINYPIRLSLTFGFVGFLYAVLFNIPGFGLNFLSVDNTEKATIIGQVMVWTIMGVFLPVRCRIAYAFNRASQSVPIDIFEPGNLRPFAQIGLVDVLIISGALVISTVQSLDFAFRPDNYSKALVIALPAIFYLAIYPMWRLHQRMVNIRQVQLEELNIRIKAASKDIDIDHINQLEILLQRRERVLAVSTWPVDITIVQRFLLYIVIPPLAWIGAALVELMIDGFIG